MRGSAIFALAIHGRRSCTFIILNGVVDFDRQIQPPSLSGKRGEKAKIADHRGKIAGSPCPANMRII